MRFAFKTANQSTTWADILSVWTEADGIDLFESGWLFDHFYPIDGNTDGPCLEGWVALAALAQATERLRIGTLVTGIPYRHPAVLANMVATLDIISNGRLELGIGAGWNEDESAAYGIELGTPKERSDRFEEACQVLIGLLSDDVTDFEGEHYRITAARCDPKGPQRPHPPICIGGSGEKRTLRTVAKYAQHWNFVGGSPQQFAHSRDVLFRHCDEVGRDRAEITLSSHVWLRSPEAIVDLVDEVEAFRDVGLDLAIIYLLPPHDPSVLQPLAAALTPMLG